MGKVWLISDNHFNHQKIIEYCNRINNLKVASELEGEDFNESEFRDYLKNETQDIKEDFN